MQTQQMALSLDFTSEVACLDDLMKFRQQLDSSSARLAAENAIVSVLQVITEKAKKQREVYERTFIPQPGKSE
jgi:DNA-binding FadR family transcriptional regulator